MTAGLEKRFEYHLAVDEKVQYQLLEEIRANREAIRRLEQRMAVLWVVGASVGALVASLVVVVAEKIL